MRKKHFHSTRPLRRQERQNVFQINIQIIPDKPRRLEKTHHRRHHSPLQSGPAQNLFSSKVLRYPTGLNLSTPDAHVLEPKTCQGRIPPQSSPQGRNGADRTLIRPFIRPRYSLRPSKRVVHKRLHAAYAEQGHTTTIGKRYGICGGVLFPEPDDRPSGSLGDLAPAPKNVLRA